MQGAATTLEEAFLVLCNVHQGDDRGEEVAGRGGREAGVIPQQGVQPAVGGDPCEPLGSVSFCGFMGDALSEGEKECRSRRRREEEGKREETGKRQRKRHQKTGNGREGLILEGEGRQDWILRRCVLRVYRMSEVLAGEGGREKDEG